MFCAVYIIGVLMAHCTKYVLKFSCKKCLEYRLPRGPQSYSPVPLYNVNSCAMRGALGGYSGSLEIRVPFS